MEKLYYYILITFGLTILMNLAGVPFVGQDQMMNWLGISTTSMFVTTSTFYIAVLALFALSAGVGLVLSPKESTFRAIMCTGIVGVGIGTLSSILLKIKDVSTGSSDWIFYLCTLIFSVYIVGFILATLEWWGQG